MNEERSCCICLEDYVDGEGNLIIPEPTKDSRADEIQIPVVYTTDPNTLTFDVMPSNFEILRKLAARNREMARSVTRYPAVVQPTDRIPAMDKELVLGLLKCGHTFHFECIWKWMQSRTKCPVCRTYTLMNQDDIRAVSYFAVFPDLNLDSKSNQRDIQTNNSRRLERNNYSGVHKCSSYSKNEMCVFSVQKEIESKSELHIQRSKHSNTSQKRLPRTGPELNGTHDLTLGLSRNYSFQNRV